MRCEGKASGRGMGQIGDDQGRELIDLDPECHCPPCGCVSGSLNLGASHFADLSRPLSISFFLTVPPLPLLSLLPPFPLISSSSFSLTAPTPTVSAPPSYLGPSPSPPLSAPYPVPFCSASALSAPPPPPFSRMLCPLGSSPYLSLSSSLPSSSLLLFLVSSPLLFCFPFWDSSSFL